MSNLTAVDKTGRIYIPKEIRRDMKLEKGDLLNMRIEGDTIVLWAGERTSTEYQGRFKVDKRIDLDKRLSEVRGAQE